MLTFTGVTLSRGPRTLLTGERGPGDTGRIARLHERLYAIDGYAARARAAKLLHGLSFENADQVRALLGRFDLLLLDEPTSRPTNPAWPFTRLLIRYLLAHQHRASLVSSPTSCGGP